MKNKTFNISCDQCPTKIKTILCEVNSTKNSDIEKYKVTNLYKKGQILFVEGNPPLGVYCIHSGVIKLTKKNKDGTELITQLAKAGDIIGYGSLLKEEFNIATASVIEDSLICFLDKSFMNLFLEANSSVSINLIQRLSQDLEKMETRISSLVQDSAPQRILKCLLHLQQTFGIKISSNKIKIDLKLSRQDLASLAGATYETVIRTITMLKGQEIIKQENKYIIINDYRRLEEFAKNGIKI